MADFIKLNGYNVKDITAREAIDKADESIEIFYPLYNDHGTAAADTDGDCTIIKTPAGNVMIDTYRVEANWTSVMRCCQNNGITSFKYVIITHYHVDHYGNLSRLINSFDCSDTVFYIPRNVSNSYVDTTSDYTQVTTILSGYNVRTIDNDVLTVGDMTIELYNGSASDYQFLANSATTDYNDYSIIQVVTYKDHKLLSLADIGVHGQENVYKNGYLATGRYDIIKDSHHMFQDAYMPLIDTISSRYVIETATTEMLHNALDVNALKLAMIMQNKSEAMMVVGLQSEDIIFEVGKNGVILKTVNPLITNSFINAGWGGFNIYVDYNNAGLVRDGSQEHPYKYINEAIMSIDKLISGVYNINVLNSYSGEKVKIYNILVPVEVNIIGNSNTIAGLEIINCNAYVNVSSMTVSGSGDSFINVLRSKAVSFTSLIINGGAAPMYVADSSIIFFTSLTLRNITGGYRVINAQSSLVRFDDMTVTKESSVTTTLFITGAWDSIFFHANAYTSLEQAYPNDTITNSYVKTVTFSNKW